MDRSPVLRLTTWCRQPWAAPLLLVLAVLLVYGQTLGFSLTNWDDDVAITNNVYLRAFTAANLRHILTPGGIGHEVLYLPLLYLTHLVEIGSVGLRPWLLHLDNVLLHLACVLLVWRLLGRLGASAGAALLGGLVFALHPLQVEAVAWVTGRKDVLSTLLAVAALLAWERYLKDSASRRRASLWLAANGVLFAAALLTKPSVVTLPGIMLLLAWWRRGRWPWAALLATLPAFLLSAAIYLLTHHLAHPATGTAPPLVWRVACVPWVIWGWWNRLLLLHWPQPWYAWPVHEQFAAVIGAAVLVALVLGLAGWVAWRRRCAWLAVGVLWWLAAFLPAAMIVVDYRDFITADRYGNFPLVALVFLLARALDATPSVWRARTMKLVAGATLWAGVVALLQVGVWHDSISLWSEVTHIYPHHATAQNSLGKALSERGGPDDQLAAHSYFAGAVTSDPTHWRAWNNLGESYLRAGDAKTAIEMFIKALQLNPGYPEAFHNLGLALLQQRDPGMGVWAFRDAVRLNPRSAAMRNGLGMALAQAGQPAAAADAFREALRLEDTSADTWYNLGCALAQAEHWDEAAAAFGESLRRNPADAEARRLQQDAQAQAAKPKATVPGTTAP